MSVLVAVGTNKGVFLYQSDAARKSWEMTGSHLAGWDVYSIHRDSTGRIYAGTSHYVYGPTFRVTDDGGKNWQQFEARPAYPEGSEWSLKRIWQITGHPTEPNTLFAGVEEAGLFVSHDRGGSWKELDGLTRGRSKATWMPGAGGLCLHTVLINPKNPQEMWVGISAVGFFRSTDAGKTWTNHNKTLPKLGTGSPEEETACCVHKVVLDPHDPTKLYMQYHGGVCRSTDSGQNWSAIEKGLPSNFGFPMVVTHRGELFIAPLKADITRFFADEVMTIYRSKDRGDSWQPLRNGFPKEPSYAGVLRDSMAVDTLPTPGVYLGTTSGEVFASPDAGESWQRLPGTLPRIHCVRAYAV